MTTDKEIVLLATPAAEGDALADLGCCGCFGRAATDQRQRVRALASVTELASPPPLAVRPSAKRVIADMLEKPWDVDVQISGLVTLRTCSPRELFEPSLVGAGSSTVHACAASSVDQMSWCAGDLAQSVQQIRDGGDGSLVAASGGSPRGTGGKGKGKGKLASTATACETPLGGGGGGGASPWPWPDADVIDVVVHAMGLGREHALLQEQACALLASLFASLVRAGLAPARGGDADTDAGTRLAAREEAARVRGRAWRGGAVAALVAAMRAYPDSTEVVHASLLALWALCEGEGASEGKQQAAAAGAIELVAAHLMRKLPPLCIWNAGRSALIALIKDEPALRRRAKRAFPRVTLTYALFMLAL